MKFQQELKTCLMSISEKEGEGNKVYNKISKFRFTLTNSFKEKSDYILYLKNLPEVYNICVSEIKRRNQWGNAYMAKLYELNTIIQNDNLNEKNRRNDWFNKLHKYIPKGLFPGFDETLPSPQIYIKNFDTEIPNLGDTRIVNTFNKLSIENKESGDNKKEANELKLKIIELMSQREPKEMYDKLQAIINELNKKIKTIESDNKYLSDKIKEKDNSLVETEINFNKKKR